MIRLLALASAAILAACALAATASAYSGPYTFTAAGTCTPATGTSFDASFTGLVEVPDPALLVTNTDTSADYALVVSSITVDGQSLSGYSLNASGGLDQSALGGELTTCTFVQDNLTYEVTGILTPTTSNG